MTGLAIDYFLLIIGVKYAFSDATSYFYFKLIVELLLVRWVFFIL